MVTLWPNGSTTQPRVSSAFGPRRSPTPGGSTIHRGVDLVGYSEIRSIAAGRVAVVGIPRGWSGGGIQVWIQHDGYFTRSMHMRSTSVRVGDWVDAGRSVGLMGMTGTASGVHHHLEVTPGNVHYSNTGQIDPVPFISNRIAGASGGGSTPGEWDEMATKAEVQQAVADALASTRYGEGNRNLFDLGNDARGFALRAATAAEAGTADKVWSHPVASQDAQGRVLDRKYPAAGYLASTNARVGVSPEQVKTIADAVVKQIGSPTVSIDYEAIADAVNDEAAKRLAG